MRVAIAAILLAGALWQGWIDWRATIGEGYAYRFTSVGAALSNAFPERFAAPAEGAAGGGVDILWATPLAPALLVLAAAAWFARRRRRGR